MLDASFKLFSREGVGGKGKRAHTMEGEAKKEDGLHSRYCLVTVVPRNPPHTQPLLVEVVHRRPLF